MKFDRRLTSPLLVSVILLGAHYAYGVLRSYEAILMAIGAAILTEVLLSRVLLGRVRHFASAYISGISVGILIHSPELWPYALGATLSIMSKYVLRIPGQHLWNPSNFGICVLLFSAPFAVAPLSVQWGNDLTPMLVIWAIGLVTIWRARRAHITLAYVAAFFVFAFVRTRFTGDAFAAEVAPITGPMYQLFALFMVTDPKTTVSSPRAEVAVVVVVAFVEMLLRLGEVIYAPFYALFLVGPVALLVERAWKGRQRNRRPEPAGSTAAGSTAAGPGAVGSGLEAARG